MDKQFTIQFNVTWNVNMLLVDRTPGYFRRIWPAASIFLVNSVWNGYIVGAIKLEIGTVPFGQEIWSSQFLINEQSTDSLEITIIIRIIRKCKIPRKLNMEAGWKWRKKVGKGSWIFYLEIPDQSNLFAFGQHKRHCKPKFFLFMPLMAWQV